MALQVVTCERPAILANVGTSLGEALAKIKGRTKNTVVARRALGADATDADVRDFANYLSRILHDKVPSVGVEKLRLIAKGLGFDALSTLLAQIESLQAEDESATVPTPPIAAAGADH